MTSSPDSADAVAPTAAVDEARWVRSPRRRLVLLSFLMLFVELILIRWAGSNIVFLSYYSNFILMGSFLGIGVGFLRAGSAKESFRWAPVGLAVAAGAVYLFSARIKIDPDEIPSYFRSPGMTGLPIWIVLPIVFVVVAAVMAMIADGVARTFRKFEPLEAYRLDILGSIAGVVVFAVMSWFSAAPITWGVVVVATFLLLVAPKPEWHQVVSCLGLLVVLSLQSFGDQSWSPYFRIEVLKDEAGMDRVYVNGRLHQFLASNEQLREGYPFYWLPYELRTAGAPPESVLVIGSGTGLDVQTALDSGAGSIDAVEIDRGIYELGLARNPERPYQDPKVDVHLTDGRAYLEASDEKFDVIFFSVPDSLTLVAGNAGVRLEAYLLTRQAIEQAKGHLKPGGVFVIYDFFRQVFVADRLAGTMQEVFGHDPCRVIVGSGGREALFFASPDQGAIACPQSTWQRSDATPPPVTDDRPFAYLESPSIPSFYLVSLAILLAVSVLAIRLTVGPLTRLAGYADVFFMGAAFLLLETKNVVQFALLFGTTWFVNAFVFGGILVTVLASIEVASRIRIRRPGLVYVLLFASLALAWAVPPSWLLSLPFWPRLVAATLLAFTPLFLANLVFAERFRDVEASTVAFGANLLGAMLGGVLEYFSLVVGYRGLTGLVALLYVFAWMAPRGWLSPGNTWLRRPGPSQG